MAEHPLKKFQASTQSLRQSLPQWMDRPVLNQDHLSDLDQRAAIHEFTHRLPRHEAEEHAYQDYIREQRVQAAGHHLKGMKIAQAAGDQDSARRHHLMYTMHIQALGEDPYGPPPAAVEAHANHEPSVGYKFKAHHGDFFALPHEAPQVAQKSEADLSRLHTLAKEYLAAVEPLEKRSKNVREKTRNITTEERSRRLHAYIRRMGFSHRNGPRDQFGVGKDQREIVSTRGAGLPEHELAHALMTPEGSTLREYQQALGQVSSKVAMPQAQRIAEENAAFQMQPLIERRAGVSTWHNTYYGGVKGSSKGAGDIFQQHYERAPAHADEGRQRAQAALGAFEEGRRTISPKGLVQGPQSIDGKINARAATKKSEDLPEDLQKAAKPIAERLRRMGQVCRCSSYSFPHRKTSGRCGGKAKKPEDDLEPASELQKTSWNVKQQRANISRNQAIDRRVAYLKRLGLNSQYKYFPSDTFPVAHFNTVQYGGNFPVEHEAAHAMMTPKDTAIRSYQRALTENAKYKPGQEYGDEGNEDDHEWATQEENVANRLEYRIDRRAGVDPHKFKTRFRDQVVQPDHNSEHYDVGYTPSEKGPLLDELGRDARRYAEKFDQGATFSRGGKVQSPIGIDALVNQNAKDPIGNYSKEHRVGEVKERLQQFLGMSVNDHVGRLKLMGKTKPMPLPDTPEGKAALRAAQGIKEPKVKPENPNQLKLPVG